jgi:Na+/melibiose symporter-like transporter
MGLPEVRRQRCAFGNPDSPADMLPSHWWRDTNERRNMKRIKRIIASVATALVLYIYQWWAPFSPKEFQFLPLTATDAVIGTAFILGITAICLRVSHPNPTRRIK